MSSPTVDRWSRRFVTVSVVYLVVWQTATLLGFPRRSLVSLGLLGFVLHMVFGKAYTLVPSYFDSELSFPSALGIHLSLSSVGTLLIALGGAEVTAVPDVVSSVGASLWFAGVGVFVVTLAHTLRGNPTGSRTGTSETKSERWFVDRYSNAFVPVVLGYLVVGGYAVVASSVTSLPTPFDGYPPRATHLLAAGVATLLVLAVGYRLLPRFLATHPPEPLVVVSLPGAAVGPVLIASGLTDGSLLLAGALAESVGVVGFSASYLYMYVETERSRVGVHSVALASVFGVLGVALGAWFSVVGTEPRLVESHLRLNLLGFLGLTVMGAAYQFYPPNVGGFVGASRKSGFVSVALVGIGLTAEVLGLVLGVGVLPTAGRVVALVGSLVYAYLVLGLFFAHERE